jgi:hypothetical protein
MPTTVNKGYSVPTTGTEAGTWGADINANSFAVIDNNLGGVTSLALSNVPVTLSAAQAQNLVLRLTGTLTATVAITTPNVGLTLVENLTTGAFNVTIQGTIGGAISAPQGLVTAFIFDTVNGARLSGQEIASGSIMIFAQTSAPAGWTKLTSHNDKALRIVSGAAGSGGSTAFSTVFSARTISIANMPSHNHAVTDPGHSHTYDHYNYYTGGASGTSVWLGNVPQATAASTTGISIQNNGSGAAMDFSVQYVDVILAQRN